MSNKRILDIPSLKEAALIATMFDEAGYYDDAALLDDFIKMASQENDLTKRAGLWSNIWSRLGGWAKKIFFKEYKELYKTAKEANEKITERVNEVESLWKEASNDFKNYELVSWREKVLRMPVYTKDLMVDYENAVGKLVAFVYKLQEKEQAEGKGGVEITPPGEGGEGKPFGTPEEKKLKPGETIELEDPWYYSTGGVTSIMKNDETDSVAISKTRFDKSRKWGQIIYVDKSKNLVKINPETKIKMARGLKDTLGDDIWKITETSGGWVFLTKESIEETEDVAPKDVSIDTSIPGEPKLPISLKTPEELFKEDISEQKPEIEKLKPEEEVKKPEEEPEEEVTKPEEEGEMIEIPKGKWVVYEAGKNKGLAGLVRKVDPRFHSLITDKDEIERLNRVYRDISKFTKGKVITEYEGPEIPKKEMTADDSTISDLIDSIVGRYDLNRQERMDKILSLNEK
jgi:hypothetical protein